MRVFLAKTVTRHHGATWDSLASPPRPHLKRAPTTSVTRSVRVPNDTGTHYTRSPIIDRRSARSRSQTVSIKGAIEGGDPGEKSVLVLSVLIMLALLVLFGATAWRAVSNEEPLHVQVLLFGKLNREGEIEWSAPSPRGKSLFETTRLTSTGFLPTSCASCMRLQHSVLPDNHRGSHRADDQRNHPHCAAHGADASRGSSDRCDGEGGASVDHSDASASAPFKMPHASAQPFK